MAASRILHVLTHDQVTRGGAIQALLLAQAQLAEGHDVLVVANRRRDEPLHPTFAPWVERGIRVECFRMGPVAELLRFRRFLRRIDPDVVHAHREVAAVFVCAARHLTPLRAVVVQRGTTHPFRTRAHAWAHRSGRTDRIIAVAHAVRDAMVVQGVRADKIDVVYGSFDAERFDPDRADGARVRRELGLAPERPFVVQVGALHPKKSPESFVRVAARVLRERDDAVFALVGDGRRRRRCEEEIEKRGLRDRVLMLGFRSDVADTLAAADVVVNTSKRHEGLTGALREALAMARPVVATATDGNPELVVDGETGLLVPIGDLDACASAVLRLLERRDEAERLGRAGRERVLRLMHPRVRMARTFEVYESARGGRGPSPAAARRRNRRVHSISEAIAAESPPRSSPSPPGSTEKV